MTKRYARVSGQRYLNDWLFQKSSLLEDLSHRKPYTQAGQFYRVFHARRVKWPEAVFLAPEEFNNWKRGAYQKVFLLFLCKRVVKGGLFVNLCNGELDTQAGQF